MDNSNWIQDPESLMRSVEKAINRGISKELDRIFVETVEKEKRALEKEQQMDMLDGINTYTVPIEQGTWLWALWQMSLGNKVICDALEESKHFLSMCKGDVAGVKICDVERENHASYRTAIFECSGVSRDFDPTKHNWRLFDMNEIYRDELRDKLSKLDKDRMELEEQLNNL